MKRSAIALAVFSALFMTTASLVSIGRSAAIDQPSEFLVVYKDPDTFIEAMYGSPMYLDPAVEYNEAGREVIQNVYETLVWYDGASAATFEAMLAADIPTVENGGISPDGLTYTFRLKEGVFFHDGTPLTAEDVAYSIQRVLRIHDISGPSWMLEQVMTDFLSYYIGDELRNYTSAAQWVYDAIGETDPYHVITEDDLTDVAEAAARTVGRMTVELRLTHAYSGFLSILSTTVASIVSKESVEAHGGIVNGEHNLYMDQNMCGTGPYMLVNWGPEVGVDLTRFDGYHGTLPALKNVRILAVYDPIERLEMLKTGAVDSAYLTESYEEELSVVPDVRIVKGIPSFELQMAGFNMNINVEAAAAFGSTVPADFFMDVHVRRAFVSLMDYATFLEDAVSGNALQPNGPIPMGMFGFDASVPCHEYDLATAEAELKLAVNRATGNSWWDDGFTIAVVYNIGNHFRQAACVLIEQALESLGTGQFDAEVIALDWPTYLGCLVMKPSPMPMYWLGWTADFADPDDFATPLLDSDYGAFPSRTGYENETLDILARQAAGEMDLDLRAELYFQISIVCHYDAPYVWLSQACMFHVERTWVNGYCYNPMHAGLYFPTMSITEVEPLGVEVVRTAGQVSPCTRSWSFISVSGGTWQLKVVNDGVMALALDVYDVGTGALVLHEDMKLSQLGAYPTGTVESAALTLDAGATYQVVVQAVGKPGGSATVYDQLTYT